MSGRKKDRPGFNELLSKVHENDVIVAESLSRFSRDLQSLLEQVSMLQELGVSFKSLKEGLNFDNYCVIVNRKDAIQKAIALACPGDIVAVLGKGHEDYQIIKGIKHHFDDHEVVRQAFGIDN